jgi:uncharacterized protein (TIGR02246 family)
VNQAVVGLRGTRLMIVIGLSMAASTALADKAKDEAALKAIAAAFDQAWDKADAKAAAAQYSEDGWLVDPTGVSSQGREAIEKNFANIFAGPLKGTSSHLDVKGWESLKPEVALINLEQMVSGAMGPDGKPMPPLKLNIGCNAVKKASKWWLRFCSVGAVVALPPAATARK